MKNETWPAIYEIFQSLEKMVDQTQGVVAVKGDKRGMQVLKRGIQTEDIVPLRAEIRNKLNFLKAKLEKYLTERETYLVLLPIVIYFDEIVQSKIMQSHYFSWPILQKELFQIDNGGEIFYEMIDDILRKPETIPFVYEVFYFCLNDGFKGKLADNALQIEEYKNKLRSKIPLPKIEGQLEVAEVPDLMKSEGLPLWGYLWVVLFLVGIYLVLYSSAAL